MSTTREVATDAETVPPSEAVVKEIAGRKGVDETELDPLFYAIDPDALDRFIESNQGMDSALQITFTYHGYDVTVTGDNMISLSHTEDFDK